MNSSKPLFFLTKIEYYAYQLEGSDHGGRDGRPSWHWQVLVSNAG
jgi:hypothetical protein